MQGKAKSLGKWSLVTTIVLVGAALACSAPAAQSDVTPSAGVAEAFTVTPGGPTPTPGVVVVTATTDPSGGSTSTTDAGSSAGDAAATSDTGATSCLYDSVYISDLSIPDGTEMTPGSAFTKTWRVQNNGCPVWPDGTTLIYVSGKKMGGPASVAVPQTAVNGTQDISVNLTAPAAEGDAVGYWQLRTPDGAQFGDQLSVKIKVVAAPAPGVTPTWRLMPLNPDLPIMPVINAKFSLSYAGTKKHCITTGQQVWVKMENTGNVKFESAYFKLEVPPGTQLNDGTKNSPFLPSFACGSGASSLAPDDTAWMVVGGTVKSFLSGTSGKATVKLCSKDDQDGACATRTVSFTIH